MEQIVPLTGVKDTNREILFKLEFTEIIAVSLTSKHFLNFCDDLFWYTNFNREFGTDLGKFNDSTSFNTVINYKELYRDISYVRSKKEFYMVLFIIALESDNELRIIERVVGEAVTYNCLEVLRLLISRGPE